MRTSTALVAMVLVLVVGVGLGYQFGGNTTLVTQDTDRVVDSHMNMKEVMGGMSEALEGKTGDAFDQAFLREMIVHHQGAVDMAERALVHAKHEEIKNLARAIIAAQNKEIADMTAWQKSWYRW